MIIGCDNDNDCNPDERCDKNTNKTAMKDAMKLLSANQVKFVINPVTHAENHAMKRKTVMVMVTNKLATQTKDFVLMVRFTFNDIQSCILGLEVGYLDIKQ